MRYQDLKPGQILTVKRYNSLSKAKWNEDYDKASREGRHPNMPQLAMYLYFNSKGTERTTGYVLITENGSMTFKNKKDIRP